MKFLKAINWKHLASSEFLSAILIGGVGAYLFITFLLLMDWYEDFFYWIKNI